MIGSSERDTGATPQTAGDALLLPLLIRLTAGAFPMWLFLQLPRGELQVFVSYRLFGLHVSFKSGTRATLVDTPRSHNDKTT